MLSRGFRICLGVGSVLVLFALGLHVLYRFYNAPADAEYDLLNVFAGTFASTILAFFIGALLFDYQVERAEAKRNEQLRTLLVAELNEIAEDLDLANATEVPLADGSGVKAVITHGQSTLVEEAIKEGFLRSTAGGESVLPGQEHARLQCHDLLPVVAPIFGSEPRSGLRAARAPRDRGDRRNPPSDRRGCPASGRAIVRAKYRISLVPSR